MIKLKPFFKVGLAPDVVFLMSESTVHQFDNDFKPLIEQLQTDNFDPQSISDADLNRLRKLDELGIVYNVPDTNTGVINFFEFQGWRGTYVLDQLKHARIKVNNHHQSPDYALRIAEELRSLGVTIVDTDPTLTINVIERQQQLDSAPLPSLNVRIGSYVVSVGPLISPTLTAQQLQQYILPGKKFFEEENFMVQDLPSVLQTLSVSLAVTEIFNTIIKGGNHDTITAIVDWQLSGMRRVVWRF